MMIFIKIALGLVVLTFGILIAAHAINYEDFTDEFPRLSKVLNVFWGGLFIAFMLMIALVIGNEILK